MISRFWLFSTEQFDFASSQMRCRNLKSRIGLVGIRGSAHIWKRSSLTEKQGQQRSVPVLTSPLCTPSPWSLLERNELSTEQRRLHTERPLAASYLSV